MAQAIVKRTVKKLINDSSKKLLLSNSPATTTRTFISHTQSTKFIKSSFPPFSQLSPTTILSPPSFAITRNFFSLSNRYNSHSFKQDENIIIPIKYRPWIAVPVAILIIFCSLEFFVTPYCRPKPVVDREDHVRYSFKLEKAVRQEDVKFKIVDNSVLELSYMYRHYTSPRIVKKELPKGNYSNAEIRGWLNRHDVFLVDITGFEREHTKRLSAL